MKRFLITTADERTWRADHPVLFLGEWCRLYSRRSAWEKLDAEIVPYHWDDREKLYKDYDYLQTIYEDMLERTSEALNSFHGVNHSIRYWRILIGPWLYPFINTLFDRWIMIERATADYEIVGTIIIGYSEGRMIPVDLKGFHPQNVQWNHYIFSKIIQYQKRIPWTELSPGSIEEMSAPLPRNVGAPQKKPGFFKRNRASLFSALSKLTMPDEAMIIGSYLPTGADIKLQIALGQIPKRWHTPHFEPVSPNLVQRQKLHIKGEGGDAFHAFTGYMIAEQMPSAYFEGYTSLKKATDSLPWPSRPKVIFTCNNYNFDEVFKAWVASKVEAGAPLVIGQHGGHMGCAKRSAGEDHQIKIADRFLTWGWQDSRPSTYPALAFTNVGKKEIWPKSEGGVMLLTTIFGLFSYKLSSVPIGANQSALFFQEQLRFAAALNDKVKNSLTVRIDKAVDDRLGTSHVDQWVNAFPSINIDLSVKPIESTLRDYRLIVVPYNSTGFLETLARNIPTIIFWNPKYFELRMDAQPYFDRLKEAGIFHETPEAAAVKVAEVWGDVTGWWNQPKIQEARQYFCARFARMPENPIKVLKEALVSARTLEYGQ